MKRAGLFCAFAACLVLLASCAARINGTLHNDGKADIHIYAALEPRISSLIGSLAAGFGQAQPGMIILNGSAIAVSMSAAPGIESVAFGNPSPTAIEGPVKVAHIGDFLASNKTSGFIDFAPPSAGSSGRISIRIDRESGPRILELISPEVSDYLIALMAPLATGETLSKAEYLMLISSVYNKGISDEIAKAAISAAIEFPGQVLSAKGGAFAQRKAEFSIPLLDLLVLETPLLYEVTWR